MLSTPTVGHPCSLQRALSQPHTPLAANQLHTTSSKPTSHTPCYPWENLALHAVAMGTPTSYPATVVGTPTSYPAVSHTVTMDTPTFPTGLCMLPPSILLSVWRTHSSQGVVAVCVCVCVCVCLSVCLHACMPLCDTPLPPPSVLPPL